MKGRQAGWRRRVCRALLVAALLNSAMASAAAARVPASAPVSAAHAPAAASAATPAATPAVPTVSPDEAARNQLRTEIADLRALLDDRLPAHTELQSLFEIDLKDEAAVAQRVLSLQQRLVEPAPPPDAALADKADIDSLRIERDRLRLAFLKLPVERRDALLERDRLRHQQESLAAEQQAAADALAASEQARDQALADASHTRNRVERARANRLARLLAYSSELSALRQTWTQDAQARLEQRRKLLDRYATVTGGPPLPATTADALYVEIRGDLRDLRTQADQALSALNSDSTVPPLADNGDADADGAGDGDDAQIAELRRKIAADQLDLQNRETDDRYQRANDVMDTLGTLQARRVALLPMLSDAQRAEATGFTSNGLERLTSEIAHLRLMARWYPVQRLHRVRSFTSLLHNVFAAGRVGVGLATLIVLLVGLSWVRRNSRPWLRRAQNWLSAQEVQPRTLMLRVDRLMQMLIAIAHELVVLLGVYLIFDQLLRDAAGAPELATIRKLAYAYAWYALALAFIHRVLLTAVSRYRAVDPLLSEKIRKSLRLVAQLVLFVYAYLIIAQVLLGRGALYGIARDVAAVGAFLVAWRLIHDWRTEVTQAYLRLSPTGRLAEHVRKSQGHRYGLAVTVAAFGFVAARGVWIWARDLALGFRQTRKALAYLFRRQLERQSRHQPAAPDPGLLPADLQAALSEDPATDDLRIDRYTQLPEIATIGERLREGGPGAMIALSGERGAGKTTWLLALQEKLGDTLPCHIATPASRMTDADDIRRFLCGLFGLDDGTAPDELIAAVLAAPPQVVMIDLAQNLMLRAVGGLAGYELFIRIAQKTLPRVLWVVAFAKPPFEYLQRTRPGREVYDRVVRMTPWTEREIAALITARMAYAGYTADYDQLLINGVTLAPARGSAINDGTATERIADRYHRLVWDYSDGNPRLALHFFRLSLTHSGERTVTVRLFPMPPAHALDGTLTRTRLVLACLFHHENLTAAEAAQSLRFPLDECAHALDLLHRQGFLSREADARYRVTSHWNRAVLRFLQRQKLLAV
ncbi:ATP-binding protein [Solimonas terrae]|uniref:ATP-binding protein n=1 Tax=Solimonas terrae TaxID=1396819 RepID=A0A6M2BT27_9GAMM|nr:ATP-binding protein [Solimonas terrae]NGY05766.1 ATP-binding protein [Solimonas terrae]